MWRTWLLFASLAMNSIGVGFAVGWVAIPAIADAFSGSHAAHPARHAHR